MQKIEVIDEYIGEILGLLDTTLLLFSKLKKENSEYNQYSIEISRFLLKLWDLRENLYNKNPQMRQFALHKESMENQQRVDELLQFEDLIYNAYDKQDFQVAYQIALQLLNKAQYGFFKQKAEAHLFCCQREINQITDRSLYKRNIEIEELEELYQSALNAENKQDFLLAKTLYEELTRISTFSQYELKGQAGMYRCSQNKFQAA